MRLLDRYLLRHFLLAYAICLVSMVALYVVIDAFSKLDEFSERGHDARAILQHMGRFYGYRLPWLFQRLSPIVCLLATLFTLAWLERQNELLPLLAAGIPTRRLLYPILLGTLGIMGLALSNREFLIPQYRQYLQRSADDPQGRREQRIDGCYDALLIHYEARAAFPERRMVQHAKVTLPATVMGRLVHLNCQEMFFRPANQRDSGGWYLNATTPPRLECASPILDWRGPGRYFLHTDMSFERLTRSSNWYQYESTLDLIRLVEEDPQLTHRGEIIALLHRRLTAPLLDFILVLLGIPFILGRRQWNLYVKLGLALIVYAVFQVVQHLCEQLVLSNHLEPTLGAWLPVFLFGPAALVLLDTIRT
jgi:lipopolysaccharide export system permease protein